MKTKIIVGGVPEPMAALNKIKIVENHEPLIDLRLACPKLILIEQGKGKYPFLRKTVAQMLNEAIKLLPKDFRLYEISALRTIDSQKTIWQRQYDKQKELHPSWPENILKRETNKYAAPTDQIAPPGHCTGGAVDLVLQKTDGSFIDFIPPKLDDWSLGRTWSKQVSPEVHKSRMMLLKIMSEVGFSNCRDEYWHYSCGDSAWAVRTRKHKCIYGLIEPPNNSVTYISEY